MFVADLHNDLVQRVIEGEDVTKLTSHGHTDIPRLLKSEIDLEILIIWVSSNSKEPNFFKRADKMYDEIERISSHEEIIIPKKISDINEGIDKNKIYIILLKRVFSILAQLGIILWIGFHQIMMRHTICQN